MRLYLDTSSLFKLYHKESGTEEIDKVFVDNNITEVFLSEITPVEFVSAVYKRVRMEELNTIDAEHIIALFNSDLQKYTLNSYK